MEVNLLTALAGYIALLYLLHKFTSLLWTLFRCYILTSLGFVKDLTKYGKWALVTGATDGIGKQYVRQLAKRGLNVVLISRAKEKLEKVQKEVEAEFNVEIKIISFNFKHTDGYDVIDDAIKNLDVGVLINNVGTAGSDGHLLFHNRNIKDTSDVMNVNMLSVVRMTHLVIKGMLSRRRGVIVHIGSVTPYWDLPLIGMYAPTKSFVQKFFKLLDVEYGGSSGVDQQLVEPGIVSTNASGNMTPSLGLPTAEDFVSSAIRTIGIAEVTSGYWVHEVQKAFMPPMTRSMNWKLMNDIMKKIKDCKVE